MKTGDVRNPGDAEPRELIERTIRVDQAGEFGAVRIYEGQLAALRWTGRANSEAGRKIAAMARAEREHNRVFDRLLTERRVRPTALQPLWSVAGFALGAATALIVTAGIGVFHVGVEYHWWTGPQACSGNVPRGLSPEQLKKYLFGAKMVRCDETAWQMWGISMAGWNAILSGGLAFVLASGVASWVRERR